MSHLLDLPGRPDPLHPHRPARASALPGIALLENPTC